MIKFISIHDDLINSREINRINKTSFGDKPYIFVHMKDTAYSKRFDFDNQGCCDAVFDDIKAQLNEKS